MPCRRPSAREHHNVELWQDIRLLARLKQHAFH